jgi:2-polyprenyl-6-methoxyphenol hydroxylase-like FAD-dependent oxidoreductase
MASGTYDIITVGGGLGGAALAKAMAEHGARVLVLEREKQFKDRVRGEGLVPWGVAETQALGLDELLRTTCAQEFSRVGFSIGPELGEPHDIVATTPQRLPGFTFYHPAMQEVLLYAAITAGAEVRRGASVREVKPGNRPTVVVEQEGGREEIPARLIVGADGRGSMVRKWASFPVHHNPDGLIFSGVLLEEMYRPRADTFYYIISPNIGQGVPLNPQGGGRVRAYLTQTKATGTRFQGAADLPRFIAESIRSGAPAEWYEGVKAAGPLATFDGADVWVEHPYQGGVVLIGDAAATSDPTWGQGLSLTVRDARVLRDALLNHADWDVAGHAYAAEHDRYYGVIHRVEEWLSQLFLEIGPVGEARRAKALPLIAQDPTRAPDHMMGGPELPADETVRRRFFGEE